MGLDNEDCKGVVLGGMIEEVMKPFLDLSGGLDQVWLSYIVSDSMLTIGITAIL